MKLVGKDCKWETETDVFADARKMSDRLETAIRGEIGLELLTVGTDYIFLREMGEPNQEIPEFMKSRTQWKHPYLWYRADSQEKLIEILLKQGKGKRLVCYESHSPIVIPAFIDNAIEGWYYFANGSFYDGEIRKRDK